MDTCSHGYAKIDPTDVKILIRLARARQNHIQDILRDLERKAAEDPSLQQDRGYQMMREVFTEEQAQNDALIERVEEASG